MIVDLLFFTLLFGMIFFYLFNGRNFLSPIFILFGTFSFSTFWIVINKDFFGLDISFNTYFVLVFSLICWAVGDLFAKYYYSKYKQRKPVFIVEYKIMPSNSILTISILLISLVTYMEFSRFLKIGEHLGGTNFFLNYELERNYVVDVQNGVIKDNLYPITGFVAGLMTLSRNIAYTFVFIFIFNATYFGERKYKFLIPALAYFPILFFGTSRSGFFEFFSWCFILSILLKYQAKGWGTGNNKIFKKALIPSIVLLVGFYSLGFSRSGGEGSAFTDEMLNSLSKFMGSSIFGLDYLINGHIPKAEHFAQHTFPIIYTILEKFGYEANKLPLHGDFFYWHNDSSNIYTALRNPIIDYSIIGMFITRIVLGLLYGLLVRHFVYYRNDPYNPLQYVVFPMLYFPLMYYFITDLFYYFFNLDFIYTLIFLYIIKLTIINRSKVLVVAGV
jgi:hypothetical protein